MITAEFLSKLAQKTPSKIVLLVLDGIGGIPYRDGKTELEAAITPNLDEIIPYGVSGMIDLVGNGITPGSGPGHLALFGYNPQEYLIGRGVLEALGIGLSLDKNSLAARGNFATMDKNLIITDRRAGRIPTEKNIALCMKLQKDIPRIEDVEIIIKPGKEHRFVVVFHGEDLGGRLTETDPQKEGRPANIVQALDEGSEKSQRIISEFIKQANKILHNEYPANTFLLRGIAKVPDIPSMQKLFKITPAAIATYPMYRGLAQLVGMQILSVGGETIEDEIAALEQNYKNFDFFFVHIKKTDSSGEDGDFDRKVHAIEEFDRVIPRITALRPDVVVITGDHSTPSKLKSHSWHPNPVILLSETCRFDGISHFCETQCRMGGMGKIPGCELMGLMLAHAMKLEKYGA
jgi:2,3-bisphosphoglycerate-independent phosphoglycerate mutase